MSAGVLVEPTLVRFLVGLADGLELDPRHVEGFLAPGSGRNRTEENCVSE